MNKMTEKEKFDYFRDKGLLPFQVEFALDFISSKDKRFWEFVSPVGLGKTRLGAAIVVHELEKDPNKHILILSPPTLLIQWKSEISSFLTLTELPNEVIIVDRKLYLELESKVSVDKSPWPPFAIVLLSMDLAKRDDMLPNLLKEDWDLVIFDESHLLTTGKRKKLFDYLREFGIINRGLLFTATPKFPENVVTKFVSKKLVDWEGRLVFPSFEKKLIPIYYTRSKEERKFLKDLQSFAEKLAHSFSYLKIQQTVILRAASSSILAIEGMLRRLLVEWRHLRNKIAHNVPWSDDDIERVQKQLIMASDDLGVVDELSATPTIEQDTFIILYQELEALLDQIEDIPVDSKLDALISYATNFFDTNHKTNLCIFCSFVTTLKYLNSSLESFEKPTYSIQSSLETLEIEGILKSFQKNGGILITTPVSLKGVSFDYVDECINYDLPLNASKLYLIWTRFHRINRKTDFRMSVLRDDSNTLLWEENLLKALENSISSEDIF